jgi:hypothetical protein
LKIVVRSTNVGFVHNPVFVERRPGEKLRRRIS